MTNAQRFFNGLWEKFGDVWDCEIDHPKYQDTVGDMMRDVIKIYRELPTAEQIRMCGYWKPFTMSEVTGYDPRLSSMGDPVFCYCCSVCGCDAYLGEDGQDLLTDFCPHCGADMRGKEQHETD